MNVAPEHPARGDFVVTVGCGLLVSSPHDLDDQAFAALAIKLGIVDLLPGAQVEPTFCDRHYHLVVDQNAFEVAVAVVFAGAMVQILAAHCVDRAGLAGLGPLNLRVRALGCQAFQPVVNVVQQAFFGIIDPDASGDVHGRNQRHAVLHARLAHDFFDFVGDAQVLAFAFCVEVQVLSVGLHARSLPRLRSPENLQKAANIGNRRPAQLALYPMGTPRAWTVAAVLGTLVLGGAALHGQYNYSVASATQTFTPLGTVPASQVVTFPAFRWSGAISPPGFSFNVNSFPVTSFSVHEWGVMQLGSMRGVYFPQPDANSFGPLIAAPFHRDLIAAATSTVSWDFQAGVLVVEWLNVVDAATTAGSPATFSFQVALDTTTSTVEFRYGSAVGLTYALTPVRFTATIDSGGTSGGKILVPAVVAGSIGTDGGVSQWPTDTVVNFTPTGSTREPPTIAVAVAGFPTVGHNGVFDFPVNSTATNIAIHITIDDPDGDMAWTTAWMDVAIGGFVTSEFESALAAVPYYMQPGTGAANNPGTHRVVLTASDDVDGFRVFLFSLDIFQPPPQIPKEAEVPASILGALLKGGCSTDAGGIPGCLGTLWALVMYRRRRYA